jgi:hypothetical protein
VIDEIAILEMRRDTIKVANISAFEPQLSGDPIKIGLLPVHQIV